MLLKGANCALAIRNQTDASILSLTAIQGCPSRKQPVKNNWLTEHSIPPASAKNYLNL
jgi:hypothetical protein